jgi:hypothetical protein
MANRRVILSARGTPAPGGEAPEFLLVEEDGQTLLILRNGERLPGAAWPVEQSDKAVDAFHAVLTDNEIC